MPQIALRRFLDNAPSVTILVVGDVMLDAYVSGSASRISPEAPAPVIAVKRSERVIGGGVFSESGCPYAGRRPWEAIAAPILMATSFQSRTVVSLL